METIIKYKALDGKEFNNEEDCLEYEVLIESVIDIMKSLPSKPEDDGCNFSNGDGYIQHDKTIFNIARVQLLEVCKEHIDSDWIQKTIDDENMETGYVNRLLSDYNIEPLSRAWFRFCCTDKEYREWGQPYYALNPDKGVQLEIVN